MGELAINDEQIHDASIKQVESMILMAELAPNIAEKGADLSIWSRSLSDIERELRSVYASLQDSWMSLQTIEKRKPEPE